MFGVLSLMNPIRAAPMDGGECRTLWGNWSPTDDLLTRPYTALPWWTNNAIARDTNNYFVQDDTISHYKN